MAYPEDLGIQSLMASAAGKTYPLSKWNDWTNTFGTNLKGYRGEDYANIGNRFWEYPIEKSSGESMLLDMIREGRRTEFNKQWGMTRIPDMTTGTWHTTDPGYAQAFTSTAEVPVIREMDLNIPIEKSTPGLRKNLNQLMKERDEIYLKWKPPYGYTKHYDKFVTVPDVNLDAYPADPFLEHMETGKDIEWDKLDEWSKNKPTKWITGLEEELGYPGFRSSATAWPYGENVPFEESEFFYDYIDDITPDGGDKIQTQMNLEEDSVKMAELKNKYNMDLEKRGKIINQPSLHLTPQKMDVMNYSKVNVPLSLQAAVAQHVNQYGDYLHRGLPNTSKLPLNTLGGWKQLAGTTGNIFKAKAHDIYQDWKPQRLKDDLGEIRSNWTWGNNPVTRTLGKGLRIAGGVGDVALGGMALADVYGGTNLVGNSVRDVNEMMGVPYKDDGTVWTNTQDYENFMNPPPPAVGQPGGPPVERFNRGGIVSLML